LVKLHHLITCFQIEEKKLADWVYLYSVKRINYAYIIYVDKNLDSYTGFANSDVSIHTGSQPKNNLKTLMIYLKSDITYEI